MAKIKETKKKFEIANDKLLIVLFVILLIVSLVLLFVLVASTNNLKTDSDLVVGLHNHFTFEESTDCETLFNYSTNKVEYKDIDSETRLCLAYQKAEIKEVQTETVKAKKKKNTCTVDGMVFKKDDKTNECSYNKINKEIIDKSYKNLFGQEIENNKSFKIDNFNICYLKDDYYYCGLSETFTYTAGSESIIYRVVKKAEEKGSDIVIYDYFVKINDDVCYKNYTTTVLNQNCTNNYKNQKEVNYEFMKKYGTEYVHLYRKSEDGNYYWISSEPVKEN